MLNTLSILNKVASTRARLATKSSADFDWATGMDAVLNAERNPMKEDRNSPEYQASYGLKPGEYEDMMRRADAHDAIQRQYRNGVLSLEEAEYLMRNPTLSSSYDDGTEDPVSRAERLASRKFDAGSTPYARDPAAARQIAAADYRNSPTYTNNMVAGSTAIRPTAAPVTAPTTSIAAAPAAQPRPATPAPAPAQPMTTGFAYNTTPTTPVAPQPVQRGVYLSGARHTIRPQAPQVAAASPNRGIFVGGRQWVPPSQREMIASTDTAPIEKPGSVRSRILSNGNYLVAAAIKSSVLNGMTGKQWTPPKSITLPKTPTVNSIPQPPKKGVPAKPAEPAKPTVPGT